MMPETDAPTPPDQAPVIRVIAMPADTNAYGDIFGGWLVGQMDLAASSIASHYSFGRAVTAAIDAVSFERPVHVGDEVSIFGELTRIGTSSMRIDIEAWRRDLTARDLERVTRATFTFVAIDDKGAVRPVPKRS